MMACAWSLVESLETVHQSAQDELRVDALRLVSRVCGTRQCVWRSGSGAERPERAGLDRKRYHVVLGARWASPRPAQAATAEGVMSGEAVWTVVCGGSDTERETRER